ncbi:MAG: hypothetical protein MJB14_09635, partial [Spirochaetes bacterium]|nr:hypothetical protein [Spirochaetota bacterium]
APGFYLNGKDYPPLQISFKESPQYMVKPNKIETIGIKENVSRNWMASIQSEEKVQNFPLRLKAIACGTDTCQTIDDEITLVVE